MNKIYSLTLAAAVTLCTLTASAQKNVVESYLSPTAKAVELKQNSFKLGKFDKQTSQQRVKKAAPTLSDIMGTSYVVTYNDGDDNYNSFFTVEAGKGANDVVLKGLAEGTFDIEGTYDASTGTINIPVNVVLGEFSTYGDVTLYSLDGDRYSDTTPITITLDGNTASFDYGIYAAVSAGGVVIMLDIEGVQANATYTADLINPNTGAVVATAAAPLAVYKTDASTIKVVGLNSAFQTVLYSNYTGSLLYYFPMTLNETEMTAFTPFGTVIAEMQANNAYQKYVYGSLIDGGIDDLTLDVKVEDNVTTLKGDMTFFGYNTSGTSYSGYRFQDVVITIDEDVFTADVVDDPEPESPEKTVDNIYYLLNNNAMTAQVTGCDAALVELNIPETVTISEGMYAGTYDVTSIAANAFSMNKVITTVTIPSTMTSIANGAFNNVTNLKTLNIADLEGWMNIEFGSYSSNPMANVFAGNSAAAWGKVYLEGEELTDLVVPEGVTAVKNYAFYLDKTLQTVQLPASVTSIGMSAFYQNVALESVEMKGVTSIGNSAFYNSSALETINFPEGLTTIGSSAFYNCKGLTEVTLPSTLTSLASMSFYMASNIKTVNVYAMTPPAAQTYSFSVTKTATLNVPEGTKELYAAATVWKDFTTVNDTLAGVDGIEADSAEGVAEYFNLQGVRVANPTAGQLLIKKQGDTVTKVLVK